MSIGRLSVTAAAEIGEFNAGIANMRAGIATIPPAVGVVSASFDRWDDAVKRSGLNFNEYVKKLAPDLLEVKKVPKELDKIHPVLQKLMQGVGMFSPQLAGIATAAGIAVAGVGLAKVAFGQLQEAMTRLDEMNDKSSRLGIDPEQLARLGYAAKMSGSDLDTMGAGLAQLNRRVSEAATGTGKAAGALKELGLDAAKINGLSVEEKFASIADKIAAIPNPADQARLAFKLFGSQGLELMDTLRLGGEGLAKYAADAERLGIVVSKTDLEKIGEANDAMDRLRFAAEGAANTFAVEMAPAITKSLNLITDYVTSDHFKTFMKIANPALFLNLGGGDEQGGGEAAAKKAAAETAAAAAKVQAESLAAAEKTTEEYQKQVAELQRQARVSRYGETSVKYTEDQIKYGRIRADQLAAERRNAAAAAEEDKQRKKAEADAEQARKDKIKESEKQRQEQERKHMENIRKDEETMQKLRDRVRDFGKSDLQKERDQTLRGLEDPAQRTEAEKHFATLKRLQGNDDRLKALKEDRKELESRSGKDKILDARSVEGWSQLRSNVKDLQIVKLDRQIELMEENNRLQQEKARGTVINF
ncbi:hypothetical protein [Lacipirellula sp.]|uniref:hypothetical protein n=1 Tax=Lacipirellula sp. TaxID=2691419 RepID=UPI003D0A5FD1